MFIPKTLFIYNFKNYIVSLIITICLLMVCIFFANIFDILNRFKSDFLPVTIVMQLSLLKLPLILSETLPLALLISAIFYFENLSKNNEMLIMFSNNISIWQLLQPLIIVSFILSIVSILFLQPITAFSINKSDSIERRINKTNNFSGIILSDKGIVFSESYNNDKRVIIAKSININQKEFNNVTILTFNNDYNFTTRIETNSLKLSDGYFFIKSGTITKDLKDYIDLKEYYIKSNLVIENIVSNFTKPENIPFWQLGKTYSKLSSSGLNSGKHISYYYKLIFRPFYFAAIILVAAVFINVNTRNISNFKLVGVGIIIGLVIHSLSQIFSAFIISKQMSYSSSQLMPILLITALSSYAIVNKFEG